MNSLTLRWARIVLLGAATSQGCSPSLDCDYDPPPVTPIEQGEFTRNLDSSAITKSLTYEGDVVVVAYTKSSGARVVERWRVTSENRF